LNYEDPFAADLLFSSETNFPFVSIEEWATVPDPTYPEPRANLNYAFSIEDPANVLFASVEPFMNMPCPGGSFTHDSSPNESGTHSVLPPESQIPSGVAPQNVLTAIS
jgi:hypothetical protein